MSAPDFPYICTACGIVTRWVSGYVENPPRLMHIGCNVEDRPTTAAEALALENAWEEEQLQVPEEPDNLDNLLRFEDFFRPEPLPAA